MLAREWQEIERVSRQWTLMDDNLLIFAESRLSILIDGCYKDDSVVLA